jgi:predicted RNase H-like HicB family nuclease
VTLTVEFDREADGRWIAEVAELSGVMVYGTSREEALARVQALALHTLADRIEHGEADAQALLSVSFTTSEAA